MLKQGSSSHWSTAVEHAQALICACPTSSVEHAQPPSGVYNSDALPVTRERKSAAMTEEESQAAAVDLANRLRLLMDVAEAESGAEPTYSQIADYLKDRGVNLSRSRWTYMVNGHRYVQDPAVFEGLAAYFDVDTDFLMGADGATTPEKVTAQLDLVRSMRAAKVKSYAARTLGDISPKALHAITKFLDEEMTHMPEH